MESSVTTQVQKEHIQLSTVTGTGIILCPKHLQVETSPKNSTAIYKHKMINSHRCLPKMPCYDSRTRDPLPRLGRMLHMTPVDDLLLTSGDPAVPGMLSSTSVGPIGRFVWS